MPLDIAAATALSETWLTSPTWSGGAGLLSTGQLAAGGLSATAGWMAANPAQTMGMAGMGLGIAQAFGSQGSAPTARVKLSPEGKQLQKSLYGKVREQYETGLMPENLASIYVGKVKAKEARTHKTARGFLTSMQGRAGGDVKALLTEGARRMGGLTEPAQWRMTQKEEEFRNALAMMENLRNIERQTPLLRAQASMYKSLGGQAQQAAQGQALGDVATWAALMRS